MVTLEWLRSPSYKWATFVANRVSEIQDIIPFKHWRHVKSKDNAADCASRGLLPSQLINDPMWWSGPKWLLSSPRQWPRSNNSATHDDVNKEMASKDVQKLCFLATNDFDLIKTFSSLKTLLRVVVRILRLVRKIRCREDIPPEQITVLEMDNALTALIQVEQNRYFHEEIKAVKASKKLSRNLKKLNPFVDEDNLLRVGGRLNLAPLAYDQRHPILLPANGHLTELLIWHYHIKHCHAGPQALQGILFQRYWIISARTLLRRILHRCVTCFKDDPQSYAPMMGNRPADRVTQAKPFLKVGVDYGGPFKITPMRGRGMKTRKAYLCLFVCFTTKAVHAELVSDLSTDKFMMAFKRFLARRGRCTDLYSDCGTNFVGVRRYLDDLRQFISSPKFNHKMLEFCQDQFATWHFNPPSAPHMGGLWEAGIRSVKKHLARVIGDQILSHEEFETVLMQVEALLNSRPLIPISSDPTDITALTPGHFLVGEPLITMPEIADAQLETPLLRQWQLLQTTLLRFWKCWSQDYLHTLQQRSKWLNSPPNPIEGTLVLIKEDNIPPMKWKLARIIKVLVGKYHVSRVAEVKTNSGVMLRPLVKLCPLPIPDS